MKKYILLYISPVDASRQMAKASPEEQAKGMEIWMQWAQRCGDKLVDLGSPLTSGQRVFHDESTASNLNITGYSVLQAESIEDAKVLLQGHPHLSWNAACSIELHETMPLPGI